MHPTIKYLHIYIFIRELSNTISFLLVHIPQHRAAALVNKNFLILRSMLFAQSLKRCITDVGT
jgi:hypothetical protein